MVSTYHAASFWQHPLKPYNKDLMNYPGGFNPQTTLEDPIHPSVNHNARVSQLWVRAAGVSWPVVCSEYAGTGFGAFGTGVCQASKELMCDLLEFER